MHIRYENNELCFIPDENGNILTREYITGLRDEVPKLFDQNSTTPIDKIYCEPGIKILDGAYFFSGTQAKEVDLSNVDMSAVKNISCMFVGCKNLRSFDFTPLVKDNTDDTLNMSLCFAGCSNLEKITIPNNFYGQWEMFTYSEEDKNIVSQRFHGLYYSEDLKIYQNFFDRGYSADDSLKAAILYKIGVDGDSIKEIVDRHIDYLSILSDHNSYDEIVKDEDYLGKLSNEIKQHPEYLLAKDIEELNFMHGSENEKIKGLSFPAYMNLLNFSRLNHTELSDVPDRIIDDIIAEDKKELDVEDFLNKLKSREYRACVCKFNDHSLKKSDIYFLDSQGFVRAVVKQNKLDERFKRFIQGIQKQNGERMNFDSYINFCNTEYTGFGMLPSHITASAYTYSLLAKQGIIPDQDFLLSLSHYSFDNSLIENPRVVLNNSVKDLWKVYSNNKCWSKNEDTTKAYFKLATIFGAFSDERNLSNNAMNSLRTLTNYIPEKVNINGYYVKKLFSVDPHPIDRNAEITIKPGIPYKSKKAHKEIRNILFEDEVIKEMFNNDQDDLDKFLKKIEPLSELMDNFSVEDMEDGTAKIFMQRVVANLYVNTEKMDVDVDKRELRDKDALHKFRKLTEKHAGDEDVNFHVLDSYKVHALFSGLSAEMNLDFAKFIKNHMRDILYSDNPWKMGYYLSTVQKQWNFIQTKRTMDRRHFDGRETYKMSFREIENILSSVVYDRTGRFADPKYDEVSELCFSYRYSQSMFENTCDLYDEMCSRQTSSIPSISGTCGNYTYKFLALDDPAAIFFGQILDCCQQFGNAGEQCMIHSCKSQNGRVFGVFDENGMMVAGSWTWRNGDTVCFDNVEAANNPDIDNIVSVYEQAANDLVEGVSENDKINKVTVGEGYSDVPLNTRFRRDEVNKYPIERDDVNYLSDSRHQRILFFTGQDDFDMETVAEYSDPEDIVHVNTSLGEQFSSTAGTNTNNRLDLNEYEEPECEDDFYEERHDDSVIDDDIDDCEIINRVKDAAEQMLEQEDREK